MVSRNNVLPMKALTALLPLCFQRGLKTISDIPGPQYFLLIGTSWKYFPIIGEYDVTHLHEAGRKKLESYGDVVLEHVAGIKAVNVFNPADIQAVYHAEGKQPKRRSHLALDHYRKERPNFYNSGGLFPSNGPEWWRLRQAFQQPVSPLQETRLFLPVADRITSKFINNAICSGTTVNDFLPIISHLSLQLTWAALFGEDSIVSISEEEAKKLVHAAEACNESVLTTDSTQFIWKYYKTSVYRYFETNMEFIESLALRSIKEFKTANSLIKESTIVAKFLELPGVDEKDLLGMVVDLLLGGVDTTSFTSCFLLHLLSQHPRCQEKLHSEAVTLLPTLSDPITSSHLSKASYTRAVLKETFRLHPISVGTSRFLEQDVTLSSGYSLPKGTLVMTQNMIACRREQNFTRAKEFLPERWLQNESLYEGRPHPYLLLPFGHGPRACIARRRAEQNLLLFLIRMSRNYFMEWTGHGELGIVTPLINKPDRPVSLRFTIWS